MLESALRNATVELDKDTKNIAGSPPIAETILRKIQDCAVFVADLSFVGQSKSGFTNASGNPREFPNPNVLIEYGYAFRCHSHARLIGVMNTAFGKPDTESLPFDLRHLRWPISYYLLDSSAADKSDQFGKLVATLKDAIALILSNHSSATTLKKPAPLNPAISEWRNAFLGIVTPLKIEMMRAQIPSDWYGRFDTAIPILSRLTSSIPAEFDPAKRQQIVSLVDQTARLTDTQTVGNQSEIIKVLERLEVLSNDT
jgi:hypothetical protein